MRVWQAQAYQSERGALGPYLGACVRNEALSAARSADRRAARERRAFDLPPMDAEDERVNRVSIAQALASLPHDQREAIERAYFRAMTHVEIAAETGVPLGTIKGRIAAALRRLAIELATERT